MYNISNTLKLLTVFIASSGVQAFCVVDMLYHLGSAVQKAKIVSVMYPRLYTGAVFNVYVHKKAKTALFYTPT